MSAFLVGDGTMDCVMTGIQRVASDTGKFLDYPVGATESLSFLGRLLYSINQDALAQRYGDNDPPPDYDFHEVRAHPSQLAHSIDCYLYQIHEGNIPVRQAALIAALKRVRDALDGPDGEARCGNDRLVWDFDRADALRVAVIEKQARASI